MDDIEPQSTWEGVARALLDESGLDDPPVSAFELAWACDVVPVPWPRADAALGPGGFLWYPSDARHVRQHGVVAHELGHWALDWAGEPDSEEGARYLAGALLLPRRVFERDLDRTGWDWDTIRARHANASAEVIARRIVQVRDAVATVIDQGRVRARVTSLWRPDPRLRRLSPWECGLAEQALKSNEIEYGDDLCYAVPVLDPPWQRVIVVCDADQLSMRL